MKALVVDSDYGSVSKKNLEELVKKYKENGMTLDLAHYTTPEEIIQNAQDYDVLLATGNPPITAEVCRCLPKLKLVQRFGIGVNSIDLEAATEAGVLVQNMPGFCVRELGAHAAALILGLLRNIGQYDRSIRKGGWPKAQGPVPRDPKDLTIGLYGFGGSAKELYSIFRGGFQSSFLVCDPFVSKEVEQHYDVKKVNFEMLLRESDVISVHVPLTKETKGILNRAAFQKMKKDALVINIARGGIINQQDLVDAIENGEIGGAGLDVFESEPLAEGDPITRIENIILTPHSAFYGTGSEKRQLSWAFDLVEAYEKNQLVQKRFVANPKVLETLEGIQIQ